MGSAFGRGGARLLERFVEPQKIGGKNAYGRMNDRRRIVRARRLPAVVVSGRRHLRREVDTLTSACEYAVAQTSYPSDSW